MGHGLCFSELFRHINGDVFESFRCNIEKYSFGGAVLCSFSLCVSSFTIHFIWAAFPMLPPQGLDTCFDTSGIMSYSCFDIGIKGPYIVFSLCQFLFSTGLRSLSNKTQTWVVKWLYINQFSMSKWLWSKSTKPLLSLHIWESNASRFSPHIFGCTHWSRLGYSSFYDADSRAWSNS